MSLSRLSAHPVSSPIETVFSPANPHLVVIAHRGVFDSAPENSLAAMERAIALGAEMMELDAQAMADGTLVTLHDDTLDRTTTARGAIRELGAAALPGIRLRAGAGGESAAPTAEHLPLLAEMLEAARGRILLNIDTKHGRDLPAVMELVAAMGMEGEVLVKAAVDPLADRLTLEELPGFGSVPFMPVFRLRDGLSARQVEGISRLLHPNVVECDFDSLDAILSARPALRAGGIRLWVNSLDCSHSLDFNDTRAMHDPDSVWGQLIEAGIGAIQTDRTADLIAFAQSRGRRATA